MKSNLVIKLSCKNKQFAISDRYFSTEWLFKMLKRGKAYGHDTSLVYISKYVTLVSVAYAVGTH